MPISLFVPKSRANLFASAILDSKVYQKKERFKNEAKKIINSHRG